MADTWYPSAPGVLVLPSGRVVRGRGWRRPVPPGPEPTFALYLSGRQPAPTRWEQRWVRWPDFWLPADPAGAAAALREGYVRRHYDRRAVETPWQRRFVARFAR